MKQRRQTGFSLVEISIVLGVLGVIVGGGVSSYNAFIDNAYQNSTKAKLEQTKRALLDYVTVNYHMPCPDSFDDGDYDGKEDREPDGTCTASTGFVPYGEIGRSKADSSDEWHNVFAYGVNADVNSLSDMSSNDGSTTQESQGNTEASYFANQTIVHSVGNSDISLPYFGLDTPVTSSTDFSTYTSNSYTVCKRDSAKCASASDYEVQSIPAVLVAFNENGANLALDTCAGKTLSLREAMNCTNTGANERKLWRGMFSDKAADFFDDQIVTISAYEIKQQVLDRLNQFTLNLGGDRGSDWRCYKMIVNEELSNSNQLNISTSGNNAYLVTKDMTISGNFGLKAGDDILGVLGSVGAIDGKAGTDLVVVSQDVYSGLSGFQIVAAKINNVEYICHYEDLNSCYDVAMGTLVNPNDSGYEILKALVISIDYDQNCGAG
ncbi:prepilin-type N-terminal cleavage/methylation domain-containing protein [Thiomicrorhabdus indica]|uniref:prepilin-type N-terminal cleavage/methylation domain-containing protein n=1 Tax=Thiomicrorhabdus indica TaxID=2267253 RepID=UPI00102DEF4C|nr:prepilin-type N-terminal cleavage/methylation domain-containing protein [Thiomicrorhabdus indica]